MKFLEIDNYESYILSDALTELIFKVKDNQKNYDYSTNDINRLLDKILDIQINNHW